MLPTLMLSFPLYPTAESKGCPLANLEAPNQEGGRGLAHLLSQFGICAQDSENVCTLEGLY
jgi:hypothetical protein